MKKLLTLALVASISLPLMAADPAPATAPGTTSALSLQSPIPGLTNGEALAGGAAVVAVIIASTSGGGSGGNDSTPGTGGTGGTTGTTGTTQ